MFGRILIFEREMACFEILMFYGFREESGATMSNDDDYVQLIPSQAMLPLVTSLVENQCVGYDVITTGKAFVTACS